MRRLLILVLVVIFLLCWNVYAKEKKTRIGIGIGFGKEYISVEENYPMYSLFDFPSFYIPIKISENFKLEPEFGINRISSSDSSKTSSSAIYAGLGIFLTTSKGNIEFYYGIRLGGAFSSYNDSYNGFSDSDSIFQFLAGPAIGGEYFISNHLSIGGEIQLICYFENDDCASMLKTKPVVFLRWYW